MKKLIVILFSLLLFGPACRSGNDTPERIARSFLQAYYGNDLYAARDLAVPDTREEIENTIAQLEEQDISPEEMKAMAQPVIIEVEGIIANNGQMAVCAYKLKNSADDANAMMETLLLQYTDDGWKVVF